MEVQSEANINMEEGPTERTQGETSFMEGSLGETGSFEPRLKGFARPSS